ncbi:hypothetical protein A0H81_05472 [Grifola frondosa]|uniref:Uncharacterized protein n=1 Tax=Grifola frondosa TaxID=5627 RepID=A0A1C7MDI0_GRIFR|nr:hypothetical protein A0H81_05472 [Grifola frondosa]
MKITRYQNNVTNFQLIRMNLRRGTIQRRRIVHFESSIGLHRIIQYASDFDNVPRTSVFPSSSKGNDGYRANDTANVSSTASQINVDDQCQDANMTRLDVRH